MNYILLPKELSIDDLYLFTVVVKSSSYAIIVLSMIENDIIDKIYNYY